MSGQLEGKVALETHAGSGIGREAARQFAKAGAKVVVSDVVVDGGQETVRQIKADGGEAVFVRADVAQEADVEALVRETIETYGRIDCAHNNAGIAGDMATTAECPRENWDRTIAINLTGVWLCMKHELPHMLAQAGGAIVNTSSVAGLVGFENLPAYVASKHGVAGLTRTAALEYAQQNIRVNAVCPGVIRTPMVERIVTDDETEAQFAALEPVGRMGRPEEVAEAVVWLCSDAASFVTSMPMAVDGGLVAR
jgi:NAD(P)-dependent dehydrogenase (short-subunit alcohol dehydrogenase family)